MRKINSDFDPKDSSTWRAKCDECGGIMDYHERVFTYHCRKCGNILEV